MKILFMCVANSARSQIAEGLARDLFGDKVQFFSAGSKPSTVNPFGIKAMKEIGIDIGNHKSKAVEDIEETSFDYVITLCAEEVCPDYLGKTKKLHWPFQDPAGDFTPLILQENFRRARDLIKAKLQEELPSLIAKG